MINALYTLLYLTRHHRRYPNLHLVKVLMLQDLFSSKPLIRVQLHHLLNQVHSLGACMRANIGNILRVELRERILEIRTVLQPWPHLLVRRSPQIKDLENLVNLTIPAQQWEAFNHFRENTRSAPNIDWSAIHLLPEQDFWGPVPKSDNSVGVLSNRQSVGSSQTEISQLESVLIVYKQIVGFEVSVQDSVTMTVGETFHHLLHVGLDQIWRNGASDLLQQFLEVLFLVVENEE